MKHLYQMFAAALLVVVLVAGIAQAQVAGDFRSFATGTWSAVGTWETFDGALWAAAVAAPTSTANVTIQSGHTVTIDIANAECNNLTVGGFLYFALTTGMGITVNGDAVVNSAARFRGASSTPAAPYTQQIDFKKNLTVNSGGTFDMRQASGANGTVIRVLFSGSSNSTLSLALTAYTSATEEFNSIEIKKTGGAKVILASGTVFHSNNATNLPDSLVLTSGLIETGSNHWAMLRTGSTGVFGGSTTSYVNGILGRGVSNGGGASRATYPVGDGSEYRPISLRFAAPANATGHYVWAKVVTGNANTGSSTLNDGIVKVSVVRYHEIGYVQGLGSSSTMVVDSISESYGVDDGVGSGNTNLCVAYSTNARATWDSVGQTAAHLTDLSSPPTMIGPDFLASTITINTGSSFFTALGTYNTGDNFLPVQMTNFTAAAGLRGATLSWKTASEVDNAGFEVERREVIGRPPTVDGMWARIAFVPGHGTSTSEQSYTFTDNAAPGRYAYRLKQVDRNGLATLSGELEVVIGLAPRDLTLGAYPNPFNPSTVVEFTVDAPSGVEGQQTTLRVYNLLGQEVATLFAGQATAGRLYQVPFDASRLVSGLYLARLESGRSIAVTRLTVIK